MKTDAFFELSCVSCISWLVFAGTNVFAQTSNWQLVWSDEFNGPTISRTNWVYEIGGDGWGKKKRQFYTDRGANSFVAVDPGGGERCLLVQGLDEKNEKQRYTSPRLKTHG